MEKIIDKLRKIKRLSEQGKQGEAVNAKKLLHELLAKYGLSINDLYEEQTNEYYIPFSTKANNIILVQVISSFNLSSYKVKKNGKTIKQVFVETTPLIYAEICNKYEWHKANFQKELDFITDAYIQKHSLFPTKNMPGAKERKLSEDEIKRLGNMINGLDDTFYEDQARRIKAAKG